MKILFTDKAEKQFSKICKSDLRTAKLISSKLQEMADNPDRIYDIKKLKGSSSPVYRLRVGSYRLLFIIQENKDIIISAILHRREAYND